MRNPKYQTSLLKSVDEAIEMTKDTWELVYIPKAESRLLRMIRHKTKEDLMWESLEDIRKKAQELGIET